MVKLEDILGEEQEDLGERPSSSLPAVAPREGLSEKQAVKHKKIKAIEDELFDESVGVLRGMMSAAQIDWESDEPPEEWVEQMGPDAARRKFQLAKAALLPKKDAPVLLELAQKTVLGIMKSRARDRDHGHQLNVTVELSVPMPDFDVIEVESS